MAATLKDLTAKATVPRRTAELKETGLEDSVTPEEVKAAIAEAGGCRADEISVGTLRSSRPRVGVATLPGNSGRENQQRRGRPIGR